MAHPQNYRAYGVLLRAGQVLISEEWVGPVHAWKYPGGGVLDHETAEEAVLREYVEEAGLEVRVVRELHDPGTRISPWTGAPYTPIYFLVEAEGEPSVPEGEPVQLSFMTPEAVLQSERVAGPEKKALKIALDL
jgi:8-oxo-dGTP pyrophosphatase MutT (NUDIX family)